MYGGGAPKMLSIGHQVAVRVSRDGRSLSLVVNFRAGGDTFPVRRRGVAIRPDGSFTASGSYSDTRSGHTTSGTYSVRGRFTAADAASGSARARYTVRSAGALPATRDTGNFAFRVNAPLLGVGSGTLRAGGLYGGFLNDSSLTLPEVRLPVVLHVSRDGRIIDSLHFALRRSPSRCGGNAALAASLLDEFGEDVDIQIENGRFSHHETLSWPISNGTLQGTHDIAGVFGRTSVHGTLSLRLTARGGLTGRCLLRARWYASR